MTTPRSYSIVQIGLHWLIFVLFVANYFLSDGMGDVLEGESLPSLTTGLHVWFGVAVLALTVLRLGMRMTRGVPALPGGPSLMNRAAHLGHLALYGVLVLLPVSGMMAWFGGVEAASDVHEVLVNLTLALIAVHTVAALFHQFVLKDNLLARMRPGR